MSRGTELYADEASAWNVLHARYTLHRINHEEAYSLGGEFEINTNSAESVQRAAHADQLVVSQAWCNAACSEWALVVQHVEDLADRSVQTTRVTIG